GNATGVPGEAHDTFLGETHTYGMVIAPGEQAGTRRGADGRHVEAVVAQTTGSQRIDGRRGDVGSEAAQLAEADIVEDDHDDVGGASRRLRVFEVARLPVAHSTTDPQWSHHDSPPCRTVLSTQHT